jgi:hypothetical protein
MEMGHPELHDVVLPRLLGLCLLATIVQQRGLCSKGRGPGVSADLRHAFLSRICVSKPERTLTWRLATRWDDAISMKPGDVT